MKGANPFALWEDAPEAMAGRKEEIRSFESFLNAVSSGQPSVAMVSGGPGSGKTLLLKHVRQEAEKNGMLCLYVKAGKAAGLQGLLSEVFREMLLMTGSKRTHAPGTLGELVSLAKEEGRKRFGTLMIIDDIDRMRNAEEAVGGMVRAVSEARGKANIGFVLSSTRELGRGIEGVRFIALGSLDEHDAAEMAGKALKERGIRMGDECLQAILADSSGNPRIFKTACWFIYDRLRETDKVISKGHYLANLPAIMSMLSREWFGQLYQETPEAEKRILAALAGNEEGMHVSEIAKKVGRPLGQVTALMKRLLEQGQVVRLDRGKYRIFARMYAKYVSQRG